MLYSINIKEMRRLQIDLLREFDCFCKKEGYKYFLSGGTLLGAIRHQGFIPWDDDIDVMMPRPDYEKFIKNYSSSTYGVRIGKYGKGNSLYANLVDERTIIDNPDLKTDIGLYIDIFPIDGFPDSTLLQYVYCYFKELLIYSQEGSKMKFNPSQRYNDTNAGIFQWKKHLRSFVKFLFIIVFRFFNTKKIAQICDKVAQWFNYEKSNYTGVVLTEAHHNFGVAEIMKRSVFDDSVEVNFETLKCPAPIGYDAYLSSLYGDYMIPPPIDKQRTRHSFKVYWKKDMN